MPACVIMFATPAAAQPSIRSAPTSKIWMIPAWVAMRGKLGSQESLYIERLG